MANIKRKTGVVTAAAHQQIHDLCQVDISAAEADGDPGHAESIKEWLGKYEDQFADAAPPPTDEAPARGATGHGRTVAREAIDAAEGAAAILGIIEHTPFDISAEIGRPANFVAKRLLVTADALTAGECSQDWPTTRAAREQASYALKGAAGLISLLVTGRGADCMYAEALHQIEEELLDRARGLLNAA